MPQRQITLSFKYTEVFIKVALSLYYTSNFPRAAIMSFTPRNRSRPFRYNSFRSVGNKRPSTNNDPNYNPFSDGYNILLKYSMLCEEWKLYII